MKESRKKSVLELIIASDSLNNFSEGESKELFDYSNDSYLVSLPLKNEK